MFRGGTRFATISKCPDNYTVAKLSIECNYIASYYITMYNIIIYSTDLYITYRG